MGDEVDRVIARHVLLLQEVGGVRFALGEDRDQHVGARHLGAARGLHMDRGALDHALEGGGRHGLGPLDIGDEVARIVVDEFHQRLAQRVQIDVAGAHHLGGVGFVDQRQQQMLQRREFVAARVGQRQRTVNGLLESGRKRWHTCAPALSGSMVIANAAFATVYSWPEQISCIVGHGGELGQAFPHHAGRCPRTVGRSPAPSGCRR
jgi:hypothetical protein